jgi:polar amino acid transport system substrate-binding protein
MLKTIIRSAILAAGVGAFGTGASISQEMQKNDRFKRVLERGVVAVGVKADAKPWGFRETSGNIVGLEIDMAQDVANALGVKLELVPVQSSNRIQFLEQGKIDLMIATMSDLPERRKVVGIVDPNYYASGTNVLARKGAVTKWEDLRNKPVCGKQGAFHNKAAEQRYGAKVMAFVGNAEAKQALKDGKCVAWLYEDSSIATDLMDAEWKDYEMPLPSEDYTPWALAVPLQERDGLWGKFMAGMSYEWHRSGRLIELEKKWGIQASDYLKQMHEKFRRSEATSQ